MISSTLFVLAACGSADDGSNFDEPATQTNGVSNGNGAGNDLGVGSVEYTDDLKACATQTADAEAGPVYLVFMFDKSGSMIQGGSPKWAISKAATRAFFESPESKGVNASLTFFPQGQLCNEELYAKPAIAMAELPSTAFGKALDAQIVDPLGDTPTYQAMQGAIAYAQAVANDHSKDGRVAIVFVTDGLPDAPACTHTSLSEVKELASSVAAAIPTYVIGVGDALSNLNEIAVGGGTKQALLVSTANVDQIQSDFTAAIKQIRASASACEYKIPPPPADGSFDRARVNVRYTPGGKSTPSLIQYNASCKDGSGWHYDSPENPTRIELCESSCESVKATPGKVEILYGCATRIK